MEAIARRRYTKMIVEKALKEYKNYRASAAIVSGWVNVFKTHSQNIDNAFAQIPDFSELINSDRLTAIFKEACDDIAFHRDWELEVAASLPYEDELEGLTVPMKAAFDRSGNARALLEAKIALAGRYNSLKRRGN